MGKKNKHKVRVEILQALGANKHFIEPKLIVKDMKEFNKVFAKYM